MFSYEIIAVKAMTSAGVSLSAGHGHYGGPARHRQLKISHYIMTIAATTSAGVALAGISNFQALMIPLDVCFNLFISKISLDMLSNFTCLF